MHALRSKAWLDRRDLILPMSDRRFRAPCIILNPRAASGKARRQWPSLRSVFEAEIGPVNALFTEAPNHATELAREALEGGSDLVVVVGGDGTLNETLNGYFSDGQPVSPNASLALCPFGTGGDFRRSSGLPKSPREAIAAIASRRAVQIDALSVRLTAPDGSPLQRYCINLASFGLGGEVSVAAKNSFLTSYNGRAAFLWATATTFLRFRGKEVRIAIDRGGPGEPVRIAQVALGNGSYHGGGMCVCPQARLDSGLIEVTVIRETSFLDFLRSIPMLYSGQILSHPKCDHYRAKHLEAFSGETVAVEIDGEAIGSLPLEAEILPSAVKVAGLGPAI